MQASTATETLDVPILAPGQSLGIALDIPPVPNLRDIGGYETRDGATVARRLAYRSDTFHPMTAEDDTKLSVLALKNDYDLRTTAEAKAAPDQMPAGVQHHLLNVLADAESAAPAELEALMHEPKKANVALGGGRIEALFVDAGWVGQNLGQPGVKLVEISDEVSYEFDQHIPGAVLASKEYWREQGDDGVRTHLPFAALQERVRGLGIDDDDHVVIYYKGSSVNEVQGAFYAYWIFDLLGHDAVSILDGGWHAWLAAGGDMDDTKVDPEPGGFTAQPRPELEMGVDELHRLYRDHPVVDGRPHDNWLGRAKYDANPEYGRIPGSLSQPWESFLDVDDDGLTYADARIPIALLATHPLDRKGLVLLTCFGATGAAIDYAYFRAAGFENLRLDDEGYKRWNLRGYPLERDEPSDGGRENQ